MMELPAGKHLEGNKETPPSDQVKSLFSDNQNTAVTSELPGESFSPDKQLQLQNHNGMQSTGHFPNIRTPTSKRLGHPLYMSSPSPAHKMPGGGTRSELYLKTVLSSPYHHKTYTPMSATPPGLSPVFKTPIRSTHNSPSHLSTPQQNRLRPGYHTYTPQGELISNPFDNGMFDEHGGPMFMSPGVFSVKSTPGSEEKKPFRWSIEHMAVLHPADIEENPKQEDAHLIPDKETEARIQLAIEKFFSDNMVAPSPWSQTKAPAITTTPDSDERLPKACLEPELQGSIQKQLPQKSRTQDVGCQTTLTLPVDFNINEVLAQYLTYEVSDEINQEMLSTSSLRRKLFFQADTSSVAPSPVKAGPFEGDHSLVDIGASPQVSPVKHVQLPDNWVEATPLKTPSRNQFSSSPIKNIKGLPPPRLSQTPSNEEFLESPELSPIIRGHQSRLYTARSSGCFVPHEGSFVEQDVISEPERKALFTNDLPPSPEISPITSPVNLENSMDKGRHPSRTSLQSPGISPIRSESPYHAENPDGSFLEENKGFTSEEESDQELLTPVANKEQSVKKKGVSSRKISHLTRHKHRTNLFCEDLDNTPMDFESQQAIKNLRFADDIKTSSLLFTTKDFSLAEMDYSQDNNAGSTNQDTGYQTASLQSTNHDTGLHTNLTTQFNSLPFNTTNQDTGVLGESFSCVSNPSVDKINQENVESDFKMSDSAFMSHDNISADAEDNNKEVQQLTNQTDLKKLPQEDDVFERARQALAMANRILPSIDEITSEVIPQKGILDRLEPVVSPVKKQPKSSSDSHSASEKALVILRRAGEDLAKYGDLLEQK